MGTVAVVYDARMGIVRHDFRSEGFGAMVGDGGRWWTMVKDGEL